ncbi:MAG: glutathione S-transferase family protein, partial [Alphaproteobacteria bacterium]|nr:glutathione S-transferase family protein [Alphaproteobacteria bacterium]
WANNTLYKDVYQPVIRERILKRFVKDTDKRPDPACIREAGTKLNNHMEYIAWLVDRRNWLAGKEFSIADIATASLLSVMDYLGIIQWHKYELVKSWYVRIKSRPSFRSILQDNVPQIPPASNYANLDF